MLADTRADNTGYAAIATQLRDWIIEEDLAPGTPLPKQTELARRFAVSSLTIWRAMQELQTDGFVVAIRRAGTFVAAAPPHRHRYALLFPHTVSALAHNRFMQALANEAARLTEESALRIDCFFGIDGHTDRESYQQVVEDIDRRRLAALLFATPPFLLKGSPILTAPRLPRAAIMRQDDSSYPQVATVFFTDGAFARRALGRLQEASCRRVAVIAPAPSLADWTTQVATLAPEYGLVSRPYWVQGVDQHYPDCARRCVHLLCQGAREERPDGLIVADDNLLDGATAGLVDAGVIVPAEMRVIGHANFPWPTPSRVPVERLGFDAGDVLRLLIEAAERQRAGETAPALPPIEPLFEDEYHARRLTAAVPGAMTLADTHSFRETIQSTP